MAGYVCIHKCFHRGRLYNKGDSYAPTNEEVEADTIPHHFMNNADGVKLPEDPTPRLGTKVAKRKENPSMRAPAKDAAKAAQE